MRVSYRIVLVWLLTMLIQLNLFDSCSLKGVPLAYDNIRIVGQHGDIYDDSGYVHMDIEANFIVFQPKRGQKLLVRFKSSQCEQK